jgi:hypothetical protein
MIFSYFDIYTIFFNLIVNKKDMHTCKSYIAIIKDYKASINNETIDILFLKL